MVYESLYGRDEQFVPRPLMVEGHVIDDDGKRWTMKLRDGPAVGMTARRCWRATASRSLQRWMKRDADRRHDQRPRRCDRGDGRPHPGLAAEEAVPAAGAFPVEGAAAAGDDAGTARRTTDPFKQVTEIVGCGPFRFLPDEYVSGSHAAFARFDGYVPRQEPASYTAGGHKVKLDRVEWRIIPDPATAANALIAGEVDWLELPQPDLIPMLKRAGRRDHRAARHLRHGGDPAAQPPDWRPPTTPAFRRAMLAAIDQKEAMIAAMGEDRSAWRAPMGYFVPGSPAANDAGMDDGAEALKRATK